MYIFNISIVIPKSRQDSFISWAKSDAQSAAQSNELRDFRILTVAAIPGDKDFPNSPDKTFSIQLHFDSIADCRQWNETHFHTLMESYSQWHGPNPLFFATILKSL